VYRVANEADIVTMVPCYPYVHAPYVHGTYLLEGGMLKINPMQHMLANGYSSMANSSWLQMQSLTQAKQQQLENSLYLGQSPEADYIDKLAKMPGAMFSGRLLKLINKAIHEMLASLGAQSLLSVSQYGTGAFTVGARSNVRNTGALRTSQRAPRQRSAGRTQCCHGLPWPHNVRIGRCFGGFNPLGVWVAAPVGQRHGQASHSAGGALRL